MSEEIRRPSDTHRMSREDIENALASQRRETLPLGVHMAIADAQGVPLEVCKLCKGHGVVTPESNQRFDNGVSDPVSEEATTRPL